MSHKRDKAEYVGQARASIREAFEQLPIFQRPRAQAVYNYVAAAEMDTLQSVAESQVVGSAESHRRLVESSEIVIPAFYDRCSNTLIEEPKVAREVFLEARQLYDFAHSMNHVEYSFELADRGQFEVFVSKKEPRITFSYASKEADLADTRIRSLDIQHLHTRQVADSGDSLADTLIGELRTLIPASYPNRCEYQYSNRLFELAREYGRTKLARTNPLEIPPEIAIGDTIFAQLRDFWAALLSIVEVHIAAHWLADNGDLKRLAIDTIVLSHTRSDFVNLISKISNLPSSKTNQIVNLHIYERQVGRDSPIVQPFLPLAGC